MCEYFNKKSLNTILRNLAYGTEFDLESYSIGGGYHSHSSTAEASLCDICNRSCSDRSTTSGNTIDSKSINANPVRILIKYTILAERSNKTGPVIGYWAS
jgi:hypothetical protein